jgi:hypothetical protein
MNSLSRAAISPKRFLACDVTVFDTVDTGCLGRNGNAWIHACRKLIKMRDAFNSQFGDAASEARDRHDSVVFGIKASGLHIDHNGPVETGKAVVAVGGKHRKIYARRYVLFRRLRREGLAERSRPRLYYGSAHLDSPRGAGRSWREQNNNRPHRWITAPFATSSPSRSAARSHAAVACYGGF